MVRNVTYPSHPVQKYFKILHIFIEFYGTILQSARTLEFLENMENIEKVEIFVQLVIYEVKKSVTCVCLGPTVNPFTTA